MALLNSFIRTPQAKIAVLETASAGLPVLLLHGNSSCKEAFLKQMENPLFSRYRLIAIDLPGHGESSDATDPSIYSIPGYADVAAQILQVLGINNAAVLGWSLGGHIGLEMLAREEVVRALMIIGAPPFARGPLGLMRAFHTHVGLLLAGKARLSNKEALRFAEVCWGTQSQSLFVDMIERTDVRARPQLFRSMMRAAGHDQRYVVEHSSAPIAVVNGSNEPFGRADYVKSLAYRNLWEGRCHVLHGAGHAPFAEMADEFNAIFGRFLADAQETCALLASHERRSA
jgi:pimeloyl-ACP methyl ester carboxylesterase